MTMASEHDDALATASIAKTLAQKFGLLHKIRRVELRYSEQHGHAAGYQARQRRMLHVFRLVIAVVLEKGASGVEYFVIVKARYDDRAHYPGSCRTVELGMRQIVGDV